MSNGHAPQSCSGEWMPSKRRSFAVALPTFGKSVSCLTLARSTFCGLMADQTTSRLPCFSSANRLTSNPAAKGASISSKPTRMACA